ncbi:MAG: hypothetical protein KJO81_12715 [Gammaproteobacteria bacterium]|nr:hypothetical protein [Gammaproteobacteria bacterium]
MPSAINVYGLSLSLISQLGWSASNFLITIVLVRYLTPDLFGYYGLCLAAKRGSIALTSALCVVPLTVVASQLEGEERESFLGSYINSIYLISALIFCLLILAALIYGIEAVAFAIFILGGMLLECARRLGYIEGRVALDARGAILNFLITGGALLALVMVNSLSIWSAIVVIGIIQLSWCFSAMPVRRISDGFLSLSKLRRMWDMGRWGLASNLSTYSYTEANTFYALYFLGAPGVAALELGRQLIAVLQPMLFGMANYMHPIVANSARALQISPFIKRLILLTVVQLSIAIPIVLIMVLVGPQLLDIILGRDVAQYENVITLAMIFGAAAVIRIGWQQPGFALVPLGFPSYAFYARLGGSIFAVLIGFILTKYYGVVGAAMSKLLGDVMILAATIYVMSRVIKTKKKLERAA